MNHTVPKILVVVESIDVNDSSASKGRVALIYNLANLGYSLKVLHYTQKDIKLKSIDCICIPELKFTVNYFLSRLQRAFTRATGIKLHLFFEKLFGFSFTFFNDTYSIKKAVLKESDFNADVVFTLSKGASFRPHYALLNLPKLHGKWVAYVHDPYPFHFYPRPYNWVEPGYRKKERFFREVSEKASYSAFPSLLLKEWMGSYFPQFLKTAVLIPHQDAKYEVQNSEFPAYFDPLKFNLLHAGNLMQHRSPEGLIQGFQMFLNRNPEAKQNARLLFIGSAVFHKKMINDAQKKTPELIFCQVNQPFNEVQLLQYNVSVNIILESKSEISPFLPGKFPHCVSSNKPILALGPYYSETRRLLGNDYLYWAEVDDAEKISKLIEKLYILWQQDSNLLVLNRLDLKDYISKDRLKTVIDGLHNN
jgi:hypothetical protein